MSICGWHQVVLDCVVKEAGSSTIQELTPAIKALLCDAASKLTAHRRRAFMANVAVELLGGSARRARSHFGWNRDTVELGLRERASGIVCLDNFAARGNKKMEAKHPDLERDIRALADPHSQADPQFKNALSYTRLSAASVRRALIQEKGWREEDLPAERTMNSILNRLGYRLRSVAKTRPEKKPHTPKPSLPTSERSTRPPMRTPPACA